MTLKRILALALCGVALLAPLDSFCQNKDNQWHEAKSVNANFKAVSTQSDIEVFSAPNIIMIKINKEADVKIFSILGKLINSRRLEPGIYEIQLDSHGIYIIKTDDTSCKVAV